MVNLIVNRQMPFSFSKAIEADYGKFEIREQHEAAAKVLKFTTDNLLLMELPGRESQRLSEFKEVLLNRGLVPLDVYCARALYQNTESMWELYNLWNRLTIHSRVARLDTIAFLGNVMARHDKDKDHFATFKYHQMAMDNKVDFIPFEDDPFFQRDQDFILVFDEEFSKTIL